MSCNLLACRFGSKQVHIILNLILHHQNYFFLDCFIPQRYFLAFMAFLGIVVSYSMRICFHITLTEMVIPQNKTEIKGNECPDMNNTNLNIGVRFSTFK